jgi:DNA-binding transcriptional LysR family regulator
MHVRDRIGRWIKLQELNALITVAEEGGIGKAARRLNTSQSAVSRSIRDLENVVGAKLFDRGPEGVELTDFGKALVEAGASAFDELRQGVRRVEALAGTTQGEVRVAGNEPQLLAIIPNVISRMQRAHPGISIQVNPQDVLSQQIDDLRARRIDVILARLPPTVDDDIAVERLFDDPAYVIAATNNPWARKRNISLADLKDGHWCLPPTGSLPSNMFAAAFRAGGLSFPPPRYSTGSPAMHAAVLPRGPFLAILPNSFLRLGTQLPPFKILPVKLSATFAPVGLMTLRRRSLGPVVAKFADCVRQIVRPLT